MTKEQLLQRLEAYYDRLYNPVQRGVLASYLRQQVSEEHYPKLLAEIVRRNHLRYGLPGVAAVEETIKGYNGVRGATDWIGPPKRPQLPGPDEDEELIPFNAMAILSALAQHRSDKGREHDQ